MTTIDNNSFFSKYMTKNNVKKFISSLENYSKEYAELNETPFLFDSILDTKIDEFKELFSKNDFLKNQIKSKKFHVEDLCNMPPETLDPELYSNIINKKKLEEFRKNNQATSDAFTCRKCKCKKSVISEKQTRAGDEPATIFITCTECGYCFTM